MKLSPEAKRLIAELKKQNPSQGAAMEMAFQSGIDAATIPVFLEVGLMQEKDARGVPKYTEEEAKALVNDLMSTAFTADYGDFAETAVQPAQPMFGITPSMPQTIPSPDKPFKEKLTGALSPQAYILEGEQPGTTAYGQFQEEYNLEPQLDEVLPQLLQESFTLNDAEVGIYVNAFKDLYQQNRERGLSQVDAQQAVFDTLMGFADAPTLEKKGKKEPEGGVVEALLPRFDDEGPSKGIPDFDGDQMRYLRNIKEAKVQQYMAEREPRAIESKIPHYRFNAAGTSFTIPTNVYDYFLANKQLADDVYTVDSPLLSSYDMDLKRYFAENPKMAALIPKTTVDLVPTDANRKAMLRVDAYSDIGGGEWYLDPVRKSLVMANPEAYAGLAESTQILGAEGLLGAGTIETPLGYTLRLAMSMPTALIVGATEYAAYPAIKLVTGDDFAEAGKEQRRLTQPQYAEDPVLGAIAADKGITGHVGDSLDNLGVTGTTRTRMDYSLLAFDLFLNPDVAATVGAVKGLGSMATASDLYRARKALGEANKASDYAKLIGSSTLKPILDDFNLISYTAKKMSPKHVDKINNWSMGDGRVLLTADVQKSLSARNVANKSATPLNDLANVGLDETGYATNLKRLVDEQGIDEVTAVKQLDELYTNNKALDEYNEYVKILDEAEQVGFEQAINNAKQRGGGTGISRTIEKGKGGKPDTVTDIKKRADLEYLEDLYNSRAADQVTGLSKISRTQDALDTIYARKMVFENTPRMRGLEKIQFVSRDAAIHKDAYPKFLERVNNDPIGQVLKRAITPRTRTGMEMVPAVEARGRYGSDFDARMIGADKPDIVFYLDDVDARLLKSEIESLPLPEATYERITTSLDQGKLYGDDYNEILDRVSTRQAMGLQEGLTTEDINLLSPSLQKRLKEAEGTSYRQGVLPFDAARSMYDTMADAFGSANAWARRALGRSKPVLKDMNTPKTAPVNALAYEQSRMVERIQRQAAGLDEKLKKQTKELIKPKSKQMRKEYGIDGDIEVMDAVGHLVIGPVPKTDVGALKQKAGLEDTLDYMFRQLIYADYEILNMNYYDRGFAYKQVVLEDLYSTEGKEAYKLFLADVADEIVADPGNFWSIFGQRVDEWSKRIKEERIDIMDPNDPTTKLRDVAYYKINKTLDPNDIRKVNAEQALASIERLGSAAYFYAEMRRIHDGLLVDMINRNMKPTDAGTLFKGQDVEQDSFDNLMRATIHELATTTSVTEDIMSNLRAYADMELRYQKLKSEVDVDQLDDIQSQILEKVQELVDDTEFDVKFEKKYELQTVTDEGQLEVLDSLETIKAQYTLDIESLRQTKEAKIEREFAPIKEDYEKRIEKARENKEESVRSKITREEDAKAKAEKEPIETKRKEDNKKRNKRYKVQEAKIKANAQAEYKALAGTGLTRKQYNAKQAEIKEKYGKILKRAQKERTEDVSKIDAEAAAKKTAIDDKYKEIKQKRKDEYAAIPEDQKTPSKVKQLRKELEAKRREIRNRYEKERAEKAAKLMETRKEIESMEKQGVAAANERARQAIRDQYDEQLQGIKDEYKSVRQQGLLAQLEWLSNRMDLTGTEFGKIHDILKTPSNPDTVRDMAYKANEYSTLILRNNGILERGYTLEEMEQTLAQFMKDPEYGKLLFGLREYKAFEEQFGRYGLQKVQGTIRQWIDDNVTPMTRKAKSPTLGVVQKLVGYLQQLFYTLTLGAATRSHGLGVATGNLVTYATTGRGIRSPKALAGAGQTVWYGRNEFDPRAYEIAVTTPTGQKYTHRQIYDAIIKSGVRTTFNFIDNVLAEGKLITFLEANNKKYSGFSKGFMDRMKAYATAAENKFVQASDLLSETMVMEDMMFRSGAMIQALEEGMAFDEAVELARRSLFDYNDLTAPEKALSSYVFVFYNFSRQSAVDLVRGMLNPNTLTRYLNMIKLHRGMNQLSRALNDDKRFPHEVFLPTYTAVRGLTEYKPGGDKSEYDFFNMRPAVPAVESVALLLDLVNFYGTVDADKGGWALAKKFLDPKIKAVMKLDRKYVPKKFPPAYIPILKAMSKDQQDLLDNIELIVGGKVTGRIATQEDYGTKGMDDDQFYVYDLDEYQMEKLEQFLNLVDALGVQRITNDYSKLFFGEGTTYQKLTPTERVGATFGLITPGRVKKPQIQQQERLDELLREMRKRQKKSEKTERDKIIPKQ